MQSDMHVNKWVLIGCGPRHLVHLTQPMLTIREHNYLKLRVRASVSHVLSNAPLTFTLVTGMLHDLPLVMASATTLTIPFFFGALRH